ncbi:MAG: NAD-dependent epimerase/dehydratase family protein [Thermoanaerobaculales bacterium]|nr:NAD-dependent epimerase/dehydratase family protein [Thermoanaerobaculales bacterium]
MPSTICITGGAGFIGSHVADAFVAAGHQVIILDDLSSGCKQNVPTGAELVTVDIRSGEATEVLADRNVDVLIHHAAQMDVRRSVEDPRFDADVNILGLLNLLEAARRTGVRQVIFASTGGAIYGEQDFHPADELHPARPISPYGVSKLASERYLYFYYSQYGIDATCLRYANVYGPRQNPHGEAGVVAIFMHKLLRDEQTVINGDGKQTRDYVYVGDVARANLAALGRKGFNIYNVGTGVEIDVNQLFTEVHRSLGTGSPATHGPPMAGEQKRSCISADLLQRELSVHPKISFSHGISQTAEWFRKRHEARR